MRAILWRPNLFFQLCLLKEADQATVPDMKPYQAHYLSVFCVSNVHVQFCQFDKADATANFHRPSLRYHFFFQLRAHWCGNPCQLDPKKSFRYARLGSKFHPQYLPAAFTGLENTPQVANTGKFNFLP